MRCQFESRAANYEEFLADFGSLFYLAIVLSIVFLIAAVLIIYYKQISEGYEDQKRFKILANVGLTEREAKKSIQTQVMLLFFLPVGAAVLHMIVASTIIRLFLRMMLVVDAFTFNMAIVAVCLIFLAGANALSRKFSETSLW